MRRDATPLTTVRRPCSRSRREMLRVTRRAPLGVVVSVQNDDGVCLSISSETRCQYTWYTEHTASNWPAEPCPIAAHHRSVNRCATALMHDLPAVMFNYAMFEYGSVLLRDETTQMASACRSDQRFITPPMTPTPAAGRRQTNVREHVQPARSHNNVIMALFAIGG